MGKVSRTVGSGVWNGVVGMLLLAALWMGAGEGPSEGRAAGGEVPSAGEAVRLLGVEPIEQELPVYDPDRREVRDPRPGDEPPPLRVLLSRERYWAEDGHLDVVVQLDGAVHPPAGSRLRVRFVDAAEDTVLGEAEVEPPAGRFVLYPAIPQALRGGGEAAIELTWLGGDHHGVLAEHRAGFRVAGDPRAGEREGAVPITVANEAEAVTQAAPVTVGVPFPRGALWDAAHVRLVAVDGERRREIPVQIETTGRWSRHGSIRWLLCSVNVDLPGTERRLELEYGPDVRRSDAGALAAAEGERFPVIEAGPLRFDDGLWFDPQGDGRHVKVLDAEALSGAFVEHEDGRVYTPDEAAGYAIESAGPERLVLRREGWYEHPPSGGRFCRYITRYEIHRGSGSVRLYHTWIFTGDGNHDRIANMGWRFDLADDLRPGGFRTAFGEEGAWVSGDYLLQHDYARFEIVTDGRSRAFPEGRAPGVAMAESERVRLYLGVRDFWQNYPSELEFRDGALWFHNWPRHNRPAGYRLDGELITSAGEPAPASAARHGGYADDHLTRSQWKLNVIQARFAHEGEMLDFRLPDVLAGNPIWRRSSRDRPGSTYWVHGEPESANAQGISRTEEMWLHLTSADEDSAQGSRLLQGFNERTVRAVVDPAWVAASDALDEMHPQDWENYAEQERAFELLALAPARWIERLGLYGMWLYGDLAIWGEVSLDRREPQLYRGLRKRHHGWPYAWLPYARSGDPRLLRAADAATRQNIDANHTHYADDAVARRVGPTFHRREGLLHRSTLPWATRRGATTRCYEAQVDYLWHAWYLTGYQRARDVAMDWARLVRIEEPLPNRGRLRISPSTRASLAVLKASLETYEATFDPWFLVFAHHIARGHRQLYEEAAYSKHGAEVPDDVAAGHFWQAGDREFLRFTGARGFRDYYLAYADFWGGHRHTPSWQNYGAPVVESNAYAWQLTGEPYYLRRVAHFLDWLEVAVWDGDEPEYFRGYYARGSSHGPPIFTGWALQYFPAALAAIEQAGERPEAVGDLFEIDASDPVIAVRKQPDRPLRLRLRSALRRYPEGRASYTLIGPDGAAARGGDWRTEAEKILELDADAPAGLYRLEVRNTPGLVLPVAQQPDTPEVLVVEPEEPVVLGQYDNRAWFRVPAGVERFALEIPLDGGDRARQIAVWDSDGRRVWSFSYHRATYAGDDPLRIEVPVAPDQAGRLWRITLPGASARFRLDPQIPPVYATDRTRWFDPAGQVTQP